jgi:hypothetical protein
MEDITELRNLVVYIVETIVISRRLRWAGNESVKKSLLQNIYKGFRKEIGG